MNFVEEAKKIPLIISIEPLSLTKEIKEKLGEHYARVAENNVRHINAYRILYRSQGHMVVGFVVEPKKGAHLPGIIYNRGGSGDFGIIRIGHLFVFFPATLARNGYVVITTQYSGNDGSEGIDEMGGSDIMDVLNLYKILQKYSRVDSKKIGMYGLSRGGTMAYLALAKVKWLKAVVTVGGAADYISAEKFRPEMKKHFKKMFGGSIEEKKKRSAIYWVHAFNKKTPVLLMHGLADWRVNPLDSIELAKRMYKEKLPYRLVLFEGNDHIVSESTAEAERLTLDWFERFVKNNEELPNTKPHGK